MLEKHVPATDVAEAIEETAGDCPPFCRWKNDSQSFPSAGTNNEGPNVARRAMLAILNMTEQLPQAPRRIVKEASRCANSSLWDVGAREHEEKAPNVRTTKTS